MMDENKSETGYFSEIDGAFGELERVIQAVNQMHKADAAECGNSLQGFRY
ncbi:MAG TPA: hypothetical protein VJU59_12250 [Paraburkholderia sp.]|nr:hypothetical protein [Paraburkholderia sp.]HKR40429.1 hypothetical protein [Paraburkholderia sp.]